MLLFLVYTMDTNLTIFMFIVSKGIMKEMHNDKQFVRAEINGVDEQKEKTSLLEHILSDEEFYKIMEEIENMEIPPLSKRHKRKMNRLFRERVGGEYIPFPEEDDRA